jgi:predicted anti-sigma-YlaC factor YlaD
MKNQSCPHEEAVAAAARSGEWSDELRDHRDGCLICAELTLVVAALAGDAENLEQAAPALPDPSLIWLRARLSARRREVHRATRWILLVQRATLAVAVAVGLAFLPGLWKVVRDAFASLDLSSSVAALPRAAGSPVLVIVASMFVLAVLALLEWTAPQRG